MDVSGASSHTSQAVRATDSRRTHHEGTQSRELSSRESSHSKPNVDPNKGRLVNVQA